MATTISIGIDLGGTKIEIAALGADGGDRAARAHPHARRLRRHDRRHRRAGARGRAAPRAAPASVGIGIPGVISPATGLVKNANSIALNGHPFDRDIAARARPRGAGRERRQLLRAQRGDRRRRRRRGAWCSASSSAPAAAAASWWTATVIAGRHRVAGEWGHTPLPWPKPGGTARATLLVRPLRLPGDLDRRPRSGRGLRRARRARRAARSPPAPPPARQRARAALARHADRLARGLAVIVNLLDPDVDRARRRPLQHGPSLRRGAAADEAPTCSPTSCDTPVVRNEHGDSSGVRGAAWLWPPPARMILSPSAATAAPMPGERGPACPAAAAARSSAIPNSSRLQHRPCRLRRVLRQRGEARPPGARGAAR